MAARRMSGENASAGRALVAEVRSQGAIVAGFVALLWIIHIVNFAVFGGALVGLGVHPRSLFGLWGILFAPFLHLNFAHIAANTIPLAVLSFFVMSRRKRDLFVVSAISALVGGLGTWLIAPANSVHVGASVLVFGYLGNLLSRGIFERRFWPIVGSLLVFFLYGGALFGVLPGAIGISWQGHLFGLIGGILAARLLRSSPLAVPAAPERRRIAQGPTPRLRVDSPEADDDLEAELERTKELVRARAARRSE